MVLKNCNQKVAGSSPGRCSFVLEGTQTKNDRTYQVNVRAAFVTCTCHVFGRLVSGAQKLQSEGPGSSPGRRSFFWKERKQTTIGPSN